MLAHDRLLDIVENFILFDESKPGATRKVIARNHQVLGVNRAVASVMHQEEPRVPAGEAACAPYHRTATGKAGDRRRETAPVWPHNVKPPFRRAPVLHP